MINYNPEYRYIPVNTDIEVINNLLLSTGFFYDYEIAVAIELIEDRLNKGEKSDYNFIFVQVENKTVAFSCYGLNPCTQNTYDLYWIATHKEYAGRKIGKALLQHSEKLIKAKNGAMLIAETSSRALYYNTRKFYENNGYIAEAIIKDFYNINDDKIIYIKRF